MHQKTFSAIKEEKASKTNSPKKINEEKHFRTFPDFHCAWLDP